MEPASKDNNYHYNKGLKELARKKRKSLNRSESTMWSLLKGGRFKGLKFRRQRPILNYIVDFCCFELMLIIEVDGITHEHDETIINDIKRDEALKSVGFSILHFDAKFVMNHPDEVVIRIQQWIKRNMHKT